MAARDLLAYGTSLGYFGVLEIREEGGVVTLNNISSLRLLDVFDHYDLSLVDMEVYGISFIKNATRLLVGTSHGILSVPTRNVDITQDCVWTNMTQEESPCPKFVIWNDSCVIVAETGLDKWRIRINGSLCEREAAEQGFFAHGGAEISCLETNLVQDLGIGRVNGSVEAWKEFDGPLRVVSQNIGEHRVALLAMSRSWMCVVDHDEMDNIRLCGMNWVNANQGSEHQVTFVEVEGFIPNFCLFPQRNACWSDEVLPVVLLDRWHAFAYDETGFRDVEVLVNGNADSVTCYAQDRSYICFGTDQGAIKVCPLIEGDLDSLAAAIPNTFSLPSVISGRMTCVAFPVHEPMLSLLYNLPSKS